MLMIIFNFRKPSYDPIMRPENAVEETQLGQRRGDVDTLLSSY